jgi:hypothetical protein
MQKVRLMKTYISFKETHPVFAKLKSKEISNADLFSLP